MPILDTAINQFIEEKLIKDNEERSRKHTPSGKLSASMLYQPLRFQVLKTLGVPRKEIEPYVLGKFKRGNDVEEWYIKQLDAMGCLVDEQKEAKYRDAVGFVDAIVDSSEWQFTDGEIPHEVKSVTNAKLRRIKKTGVDYHYKMQACFYALAMESDTYAIDIISAEDLRVQVHLFKTNDMRQEVDSAISRYMKAMENWKKDRELPKFEPNAKVPWTTNPKYAMFDSFWFEAPDSAVISKLEKMEII